MLFAVLANLGRPIGGIIMTELSNGDLLWINEVGDRFEEDWHEGKYPRIEDLLGDSSGTLRCVLLEHLLGIELELRRGAGEVPLPDEYLERFPDHRAAVAAAFREQQDTQRNDCQKSAAELGDPTLPIIQGFNVLRLLGAGTFGEVWLAEDLNLDRRLVALKALKPRSRSTAEERQRALEILRNEAGLLSKVKHRNVNQVFFWVQSDGNHFLVLNYVAGGSLGGRMKRDGSFGWQDAARYIADVGEGLQAVHARGIVHRDIKPSNILWDPDTDEALLTDFGIAAQLGDMPSLGGTLAFMAPEAFKGKISPALDVYGLAATLFLLVTGEVPFPGPEVSDFYRQIEKGLPDIDPRCKGLPEPLEQVIRAGLAVDPDCRPNFVQFIATLRGALNQLLADSLIVPQVASAPTTEPMPGAPAPLPLLSTETVPATPVNLRLLVSRHQVGPDAFVPLLSLIGEREEDRGECRPYVATRDMKRVRAAVQQLQPGDWNTVVLELDHTP